MGVLDPDNPFGIKYPDLELNYRYFVEQQRLHLESFSEPPKIDHKLNKAKVKLKLKIKNKNAKKLALGLAAGLIILLILFMGYSVFLPKTLNYSFSSATNCVSSPLFLPKLFKIDSKGSPFNVNRDKSSFYAGSLCSSLASGPKNNTRYIVHENINILGVHLGKTIYIKTAQYPMAAAGNLGIKAIPIQKPLSFKLESSDKTFNYDVVANGLSTPCTQKSNTISCSLASLKLAYGTPYTVSLVRMFNKQTIATVFTKKVQTITATAITATSIGEAATVYTIPTNVVIMTSKPIAKLDTPVLSYKNGSGADVTVPTKATFSGNQITVSWSSPLARQISFDLHIPNLTASDDSELEQAFDLNFTTSGGPSVTGSNIPSYGLNSGQAMVLSFNQPLAPSQNFSSLVSLLVNGNAVEANVALSGTSQLVITPAAAYPVCATVKVSVSPTVSNDYGVAGNSSYSYSTRSHCYSTFSIGTSVQGRPITAYKFGTGSSMVLYIAAMEGNEQNSANLLTQWIPDVDANPSKIPAYRTLVIIPQINPDGYAADTRLNAAGVDLNRNFPANNWSEQVTEPLGNGVVTNDGGTSPLSTPESQALAAYYEANKPRLTLTEHSHGGIVEANDAGDSIALGAQYAKLADYKPIPTYAIGNFFDYTTTGAFEDWANDKLNLPVLEIELESATNDEYSRNLPALWAMANVSP